MRSHILGPFLLLVLPTVANGQFFGSAQSPDVLPPSSDGSSAFADPIRRALGLWGRLLNRMAQSSPPTDDELHLRVDERPAFDFDSLPNLFPSTMAPLSALFAQSLGGLGGGAPGTVGSSKIIDEGRLNRLLPRLRADGFQISAAATTTAAPTTQTATTTTTEKPTTTTEAVATTEKSTAKPTEPPTTPKPVPETTAAKVETTTTAKPTSPPSKPTPVVTASPSKSQKPNKNPKTPPKSAESADEESQSEESDELITRLPTIADSLAEEHLNAVKVGESAEGSGLSEEEQPKRESVATTPKPSPTTAASTTTAVPTSTRKMSKRRLKNADIPEAEEETAEFQRDDPPQTTTTTPDVALPTLFPSLEQTYFVTEKKMEKMLTPVSSIIDGIGPLILPLLGYSRQAMTAFNPATVAAVASVARPVAAGVRSYQPQQQPAHLPTSTAQRRLPAKPFPPKDAQMKTIPPPVALPPGSEFNDLPTTERPTVMPVGTQPTFQRMVNAEAMVATPRSRFLPDPPALQSGPALPDAAILDAYRQVLAKKGLEEKLNGMDNTQLAQIIQLASQMPRVQNEFVAINSATGVPDIRRQPSADDPGYQMGRSSVVNSFYEDSGLMVGTSPDSGFEETTAPQPPAETNSIGGGFGGGRRPQSSFEQMALVGDSGERLSF